MKISEIKVDNGYPNQRKVLNLPIDNETKRVFMDLRYVKQNNLWYFSITDAQSGKILVSLVPIITSHTVLNDLLEPFTHKFVGHLACVPIVDVTSSDNPGLNNWNEFSLVWGDTFG